MFLPNQNGLNAPTSKLEPGFLPGFASLKATMKSFILRASKSSTCKQLAALF
jgi:hypothetical protein